MLALSATYPESLAQYLTRYMNEPTFVRLNPSDLGLKGKTRELSRTFLSLVRNPPVVLWRCFVSLYCPFYSPHQVWSSSTSWCRPTHYLTRFLRRRCSIYSSCSVKSPSTKPWCFPTYTQGNSFLMFSLLFTAAVDRLCDQERKKKITLVVWIKIYLF